jgi:predicted RNA-binding protein with PIN domain
MGGSSGGGLSSIDLSKLTKVAEDRLRQLAQTGTRILFACEKEDRKALDSHISRSKVFDKKNIAIFDSTQSAEALREIDKCSVVVVFTDVAQTTDFLNQVAEASLQKKKQGIHAKAHDKSSIPSKVMAYRWPSLDWDKVEAMFKD